MDAALGTGVAVAGVVSMVTAIALRNLGAWEPALVFALFAGVAGYVLVVY